MDIQDLSDKAPSLLVDADDDFQNLQRRAGEALHSAAPADYVRALSVLTAQGNVYDFVVSDNGSPLRLSDKLLSALASLKEQNDAVLQKVAVATAPYQGTGFVVDTLCKLDPRNVDTLILWKECERYTVCSVKEVLERRKAFPGRTTDGRKT